MQITRQRMRPEVNIITTENCPSCTGTGKISCSLLLEDEIEKKLVYLVTHSHKNLTLSVHPIVYSHLTKGWFTSIAKKWKRKHGIKLKVIANTSYGMVEFHFFDHNDEEIKF
jgi:ribonuclease G